MKREREKIKIVSIIIIIIIIIIIVSIRAARCFIFPREISNFSQNHHHIIRRESRKRRARRLTIITTTNARRSRLARLQRTFAHLSLSASFISSRKQRKRERKEIQKKTYQSFHIRQGLGVILHRLFVIHRRQLLDRTVLRYDRRRV